MKKKIFACASLLMLGGCSAFHGLWDGVSGTPLETVDSPTFYHIGQLLVPFLSQLLALLQRALIGGVP